MKKSLRRKLLLSGLAMGVAAISLASTTYAWFVQNTTVDAENMNALVNVPQSLTISKQENGVYGTSVDFTQDHILSPVALADDGKFYEVIDVESVDPVTGKVMNEGTAVKFDSAAPQAAYFEQADGNEFYTFTFYLRYDGEADTTKVNGTLTYRVNNLEDVKDALVTEISYNKSETWSPVACVYDKKDTELTLNLDQLTLTNGVPYEVSFRVWLNGEHDNCANSKITKAHRFEYNFNYTIAAQ